MGARCAVAVALKKATVLGRSLYQKTDGTHLQQRRRLSVFGRDRSGSWELQEKPESSHPTVGAVPTQWASDCSNGPLRNG